MAIQDISFSDPTMAQQLRQLDFETTTGIADLELDQQRLLEDQNLFRPYLKRRFAQQSEKTAGAVAGRGFHGRRQGPMHKAMRDLGEEQAFTLGEFERGTSRQLTDIERAIANLSSRGIRGGAEAVRGGAGRQADYLVGLF